MNQPPEATHATTLAEDLLLPLFQPDSGTIAGENTLFYVLAGAVLADLALDERVTSTTTRAGVTRVAAVAGPAPADGLLRTAWEYVSDRPRPVQTVLPAIGPALRRPILDRLIARGDIRQGRRKALGLFETTVLRDGGTGRRGRLPHDVRMFLVDGAEPTPRTAALAGLVWASGTLPQFDPDIPWTSAVIARAQDLEHRDWGVGATAEAVTRTLNAIIANSILVATTARPR